MLDLSVIYEELEDDNHPRVRKRSEDLFKHGHERLGALEVPISVEKVVQEKTGAPAFGKRRAEIGALRSDLRSGLRIDRVRRGGP